MLPKLLLLYLSAVISVQGSEIKLTSSPSTLKPPLTETLTLKCSLQDTTQTISGTGSIIGRKKRDVTGPAPHVTVSANQDKPNQRKVGVTNTSTNADFAYSIVVSKEGTNLAAISEHVPVRAMVSSPSFKVTGSLTEKSGERGYLLLTWTYPTQADSGNYRCDIDAVDLIGRSYDFSQTAEVTSTEISFGDLVDFVQDIVKEKEIMKDTIEDLKRSEISTNATIKVLKQNEQQVNNEMISLKQHNQELESKLNKTSTRIFFSAGITRGVVSFTSGDTIVYDHVFSNIGGAYQPMTGVFKCPVAGYYLFTINAVTNGDENAWLQLKQNDQVVMEASSNQSKGYAALGNDVIIKLSVNDTVRVVALQSNMEVWSYSIRISTTFSGHLIQVI